MTAKKTLERAKSQSDSFIEAARELGCDDDPAHFDEMLKKVARHNAPGDHSNRPGTQRVEPQEKTPKE
ncbi:MAG: hypothetical protein WBQ53_15945 [Methylocystis sp.]